MDMTRRRLHWSKTKAHRLARGERHGGHKLTQAAVDAIRQEYGAGSVSMRTLAQEHGVAVACVFDVVHGRTWR
jgi:hypothetical protein